MTTITLEGARDGVLHLTGLSELPVRFELRVEQRGGGAGALEAELRHERVGNALRLAWRLHNRGDGPVLLDGVSLEASAGSWPLLADPSRLRVYQHGYQSWTPSMAVAGDSRSAKPLIRSFALMNHFVDSPLWRRKDGVISSLLTVLQATGEPHGVLLGFTSQRAGLGELFYCNRGTPSLVARLDYGGKRLLPGESLEGEGLRVERGPVDALLTGWADALAAEMGARVPERSPVGWCSWYEYYTKVRPEHLLANADLLATRPRLGVDFVQLDDGYQPHVGDWLELHDSFAGGLEPLTRHIRQRGFQAGIWTAPFFAAAGSRLFSEHRDWFLHRGGRPVATGFNPEWRARTFALDPTHPAVLAWLGEVFSGLVDQGFDYHKIDFLFAGLRHGDRHDPGRSPVEAYRAGLGAIRDAIGPDRFLLGCGAPLGPSVGAVDGMRVSQDVKEQWDSWLAGLVGRGCGYPAARGALRTNMTRWFMHRRLWANDPDCLLVREHDTKLGPTETETLVSLLGATGGMLFLSDDLPRVSEPRLDLAAAVLPPSHLVGRPSDTMADSFPADFVVDGVDGRRLAVLVNWTDTPMCRPLPHASEDGSWFDLWAGAVLEQGSVELAPRGVRALRFEPDRGAPRLVGDTLHLLAAVDGRFRVRFDGATGRLDLSFESVARERGQLHLALPDEWELDPTRLPPGITLLDAHPRRPVLGLEGPVTGTLALWTTRSPNPSAQV